MVQALEETEKQDLPQAFRLLGEMNNNVLQVTQLVDSMLARVKSGEMSTDKGLSFLEMKYHMLLSYLINLTYIVLRKCSGERIVNDPAIERLIEIRTVLEKVRPIDTKLKYQVDKVVKSAVSDPGASNETTILKARPENLVSKVDEESNDSDSSSDEKKDSSDRTGIYVPPKLAAVHYNEDDKKDRDAKLAERNKRKMFSSSVMRELQEEYTDTPTEISTAGRHSNALSKYEQEKEEYEEKYLTRLPVTKAEKHKQRKMSTMGTLGDEVTSFGGFSSSGGKGKKRKMSSKKKSSKRKKFF